MTLLPHPDRTLVKSAEGERYKVGPQCQHPTCQHWADHAHHLWRRSFIGGDIAWVEFDGCLIRNKAALCYEHHAQVTDNDAWVHWDGKHFQWYERIDKRWPLTFLETVSTETGAPGGAWEWLGPLDEIPANPISNDLCPTCGKPKHAKKEKVDLPPGEKRPRASWVISVPKDEREDGADVLDVLLVECAKILGRDEDKSWKYFTLVETLVQVVQHGHLMVSDG